MTNKLNFTTLLSSIELTQTQRRRAEELYTNLCSAIQDQGYDVDFYAQGSFATRTAIKPIKKGEDQAYDVDIICEFKEYGKNNISADELMELVKDSVKQIANERSLDYKVFDRCVTVEYADVN